MNVSRAISRLKGVFVSFYKAPANAAATEAEDKELLNFMYPMTASAGYDSKNDIEIMVTRFPFETSPAFMNVL